jgi:hypothetical protein
MIPMSIETWCLAWPCSVIMPAIAAWRETLGADTPQGGVGRTRFDRFEG